MKTLVIRGKYKGQELEVSQWCNDWFSLNSDDIAIATKPFSPTMLAFTPHDMKIIKKHKNNGMLFQLFEYKYAPPWTGGYFYTFKKRKFN